MSFSRDSRGLVFSLGHVYVVDVRDPFNARVWNMARLSLASLPLNAESLVVGCFGKKEMMNYWTFVN
jgi:hypothetical protein